MKASYRKYLKFAVFGVLAFCGVMLGNVEDAAAESEKITISFTHGPSMWWKNTVTIDESGLSVGKCEANKNKNNNGTLNACPLVFTSEGNKITVSTDDTVCLGGGSSSYNVTYDGGDANAFAESIKNGFNSKGIKCNGLDIKIDEVKVGSDIPPKDPEPEPEPEPDPNKVEQNCGNGGGAQSLGWIVCPLMTWAGEAAEGLYGKFVEPALQVEPQLFTSSNGNTLTGWETFRDIANIVFAILFLVVIFSQLTGVGINNYGIKKILPKLIVIAILINLSYFICVALVDVSNILGNGLQALFDGLGSSLNPTITVEDADFGDGVGVGKEILATGGSLAALGIAGALVAMSGGVWALPGIVITLVISIIGVAISIMMLFILLAAREAAIVVLVVISPLAVICYALPNTKKLFTKWLNIFKALLILYPVAGLLVGGGNYVSSLLLTTGMGDGIFTAVTAMLAGIVPIFFIPSLTKNAFSGLGNLGAKIGSFGDKLGTRAQKGVQNSQAYKGMQDKAKMFRDRNMAGVKRNGEVKNVGRFGRFMRGGKMGMAMSRQGYLDDLKKRNQIDNMMGTGFNAAVAGVEAKADDERTANYESLIKNGQVSGVNANNAESVGTYHRQALTDYANAETQQERNDAMARVKAAQNILSKTEAGRGQVRNNLTNAVRSATAPGANPEGYKGVQAAAGHLMNNFGELYKGKNRGTHALINDLASGTQDALAVGGKIVGGKYDVAGVDKYTAETLASADEQALINLRDNIANMNDTERAKILETVSKGLLQNDNPSNNYSLQPKIKDLFKDIKREVESVQGPPVGP